MKVSLIVGSIKSNSGSTASAWRRWWKTYLREVVQQPAQPLAPAVQELQGILALSADFDYKMQRDEPAR